MTGGALIFCVVYRFIAKPGQSAAFEKAWHDLTRFIFENRGSLGSRLHLASTGQYIAYAQWPSKEAWQSPSAPSPRFDDLRAAMRSCCDAIETLHELEVIDDLLQFASEGRKVDR